MNLRVNNFNVKIGFIIDFSKVKYIDLLNYNNFMHYGFIKRTFSILFSSEIY